MERPRPLSPFASWWPGLLLSCALHTACAPPTSPDTGSLPRFFPAHGAAITGGAAAVITTPAGFSLGPRASLHVDLPSQGDALIRMETPRGFSFSVREMGAAGPGIVVGSAVAFARARDTSWWRSAGEGAEEWLLVSPGASPPGEPLAAWEIGGGSVRCAASGCEIVDEAGVARARVAAPIAYAESGRPLRPRLATRGARIELFVDDIPLGERLLVDPTWTPTSAMSVAREGHTATLLPSGQVLIAGGNGTAVESSAEIYDPVTMTFTLTPTNMANARVNHVAVALSSGKVLVAGGDPTGTAEIYDPVSQTWSDAGMLSTPRSQATGSLLADGRVLVAGGGGAAAPSADLYDPVAGTWSAAAPLDTPRGSHTATPIAGGKILVAGGIFPESGPEVFIVTAEIYDPVADTWTATAPMVEGVAQHTATALADGRVLIAGGTARPGVDSLTELSRSQLFDPAAGTWSAGPSMNVRRAVHTATLLPTGAVLVTGGLDASLSAESSAEILDPTNAAGWLLIAPMTRDRINHTATALADGSVLVAGGEQQSSAEVFELGVAGAACTVDAQCASDHCTDHVCCASACEGPCHTCAGAASPGTCVPVSPGTDPRGDCGDGGACDPTCGAGSACASRTGTPCILGGCTPDGESEIAPAVCVADVADCPMVATPCAAGYRCDQDAGACRDDCRSLADCATGFACDPSKRCVRPSSADNGTAPTCAHGELPGGAPSVALTFSAALLALSAVLRARGRKDP